MRAAGWWGSLILVVIAITCLAPHGQAEGAAPARPAMQSSSLNLVMPAGCPAGGCAAGQRFNLSFDFALQSYDPSASPNVKLCFYAPSGWNVVVDATDPGQGQLTGAMEHSLPWEQVQQVLNDLLIAMGQFDVRTASDLLRRAVVEYRPTGEIVDGVWCRRESERGLQSKVTSLGSRRVPARREAGPGA